MSDAILIDQNSGDIFHIGAVRVRILENGSRTDNRFGAAEFVVPAKTAPVPPHVHRMHDETFLITKGVIRFTTGGRQLDAHPGDYVVVPVGAPHAFSNPFEEESIFFNTFTPAYYVNYFRDLAAVASTGAVDQTRVLAVMAKYATEPA
jgi:quercetin dioxygenase-like cupin family protein